MRPSSLDPGQTDPVYARETRPHGSWYGAVEMPDGQVLLLGALGLESHVWIQVESLPRAKARFDDRQLSTDRISAVQYVKFSLTPEQATQFPSGAKLVVDHPHYQAERVLSPLELAELSADIA